MRNVAVRSTQKGRYRLFPVDYVVMMREPLWSVATGQKDTDFYFSPVSQQDTSEKNSILATQDQQFSQIVSVIKAKKVLCQRLGIVFERRKLMNK